MIALVDYGAGNLTSVRKALSALDAPVWTPAAPEELERASRVIVPGVGHFDATRGLTPEWRTAIRESIDRGKPMLGICVGLQWLFEGSTEAPDVRGLGAFPGICQHLGATGNPEGLPPQISAEKPSELPAGSELGGGNPLGLPVRSLKVPHVGWNSLTFPKPTSLMAGVTSGTQVYFTHSYAAPVIADTAAICDYGVTFSAAVERDNVSAVQFHPEKSGDAGLRILRNWLCRAQ